MMELVRVFFGYCFNCRRPALVGEFKLPGWQHVFHMCSGCMRRTTEKLVNEESTFATQFMEEVATKGPSS